MANENRYYKTPFAESGSKTEVPDVSVGGVVGYDTGFGPDYELPAGDIDRKRIERDYFNGLNNSITKNLKQWQEGLYPTWIENDGDGAVFLYPIDMIVAHNGGNWRSLVADNQEEPGTGVQWSSSIAVKTTSDNTYDAGTMQTFDGVGVWNYEIIPLVSILPNSNEYLFQVSSNNGDWIEVQFSGKVIADESDTIIGIFEGYRTFICDGGFSGVDASLVSTSPQARANDSLYADDIASNGMSTGVDATVTTNNEFHFSYSGIFLQGNGIGSRFRIFWYGDSATAQATNIIVRSRVIPASKITQS